jgi:hypothetical protein
MYFQKVISQETVNNKTYFLLESCQPLTKKAGLGSVPKCQGSTQHGKTHKEALTKLKI